MTGAVTPAPASADAQPSSPRGWVRKEQVRTRLLLALPLFFVLSLFGYPLLDLFWSSLSGGAYPGAMYVDLAQDPLFLLSLRNTLVFAFLTSFLAALLGYPVALLVGFSRPGVAAILLLLVMVPFWTSVLVRTYAWLVILGREGLVNSLWLALFQSQKPLQLIYNGVGVTVAMVHVMLPYMILPIVSVIARLDKSVLAAANSLGANRWQTFVRVLLPLTLPGVAGGFALVFVLSLGFFITPALMGGPRNLVTAMVIHDQITRALAWDRAAGIAFLLLAIMGGIFFVFARIFGLRQQMSISAR
jgi:putative spermidine/putrescine transport system permease protein